MEAVEERSVFLQIQVLKPGDVFGLSLLKFDETDNDLPNPEVSVVSNGAEVIMLSMDTFLKYSDDNVKLNVRQMIQPYPSTEEMQRKLQHDVDWNYFKHKTMQQIYKNIRKEKL